MASCHNENCLTVVKDSLRSISEHLNTAPKARPSNDIKACVTKIHNLVLLNNNPLERFYFITLLCKICSNEKPNKVDKLIKVVLPSSPSPQSIALVSDIINFALCYPSSYSSILDNLSSYLNTSNDMIKIEVESWYQAVSLPLDSPNCCSALLSRQDLLQMGIAIRLIAKWLQDLSKTEQEFYPVNLSQIIRYSLLDCHKATSERIQLDKVNNKIDTSESDLHFCILTLIQSRRCLTLTNQFLIEIANNLAQNVSKLNDDIRTTRILDKFGQILSVAAASKATSITNSLRNALAALDSNQLIAAVIKWQNK